MKRLLTYGFIVLAVACSSTDETTTESGLKFRIVKEGDGVPAKKGDTVEISESTSYSDGTLLFSTDQIGGSLKFTIGANQVIAGVDEGVAGMKEGEIRHLVVPPSLSIRSEYPPSIHPDSTLYYVIELISIQ